jgi:hypothetical protein
VLLVVLVMVMVVVVVVVKKHGNRRPATTRIPVRTDGLPRRLSQCQDLGRAIRFMVGCHLIDQQGCLAFLNRAKNHITGD